MRTTTQKKTFSKFMRGLFIILTIELIILSLIIKTHMIAKASTVEYTDEIIRNVVILDDISNDDIEKEELVEKYRSVFAWQIYGGDFRKEQLFFLKEQCDKYGIPMELMLSLICTESSFRSDAKAETSTASGYCQIIKSTAEWIYEDKLHYGEYDVENHREIMTTNWKLNIEISCRLISCLYYNNAQSWTDAIKKYYGSTNDVDNIIYLNKVNHNMIDLFNITIYDLT